MATWVLLRRGGGTRSSSLFAFNRCLTGNAKMPWATSSSLEKKNAKVIENSDEGGAQTTTPSKVAASPNQKTEEPSKYEFETGGLITSFLCSPH
ncbi:hypothetical protein BVC80_9097g202 [Macleaya cordata]|uniref:Uncharacterized protein n=1 Tax=Macleaya cordata TaxID=56857 RepID=A0A200QFB4_MACCD|nr:hypothetical protein BVC80_9097g202 [Macleaya cordata]